MQIQVNTDNHIRGSKKLTNQVEDVLEDSLGRFAKRITRVVVHLTDENSSAKTADDDIKCVIEARVAGLKPVVASDQCGALQDALVGAAEKLARALEHKLGRLEDR
jgi:ribosome-associated translation inhibitor RaiA